MHIWYCGCMCRISYFAHWIQSTMAKINKNYMSWELIQSPPYFIHLKVVMKSMCHHQTFARTLKNAPLRRTNEAPQTVRITEKYDTSTKGLTVYTTNLWPEELPQMELLHSITWYPSTRFHFNDHFRACKDKNDLDISYRIKTNTPVRFFNYS